MLHTELVIKLLKINRHAVSNIVEVRSCCLQPFIVSVCCIDGQLTMHMLHKEIVKVFLRLIFLKFHSGDRSYLSLLMFLNYANSIFGFEFGVKTLDNLFWLHWVVVKRFWDWVVFTIWELDFVLGCGTLGREVARIICELFKCARIWLDCTRKHKRAKFMSDEFVYWHSVKGLDWVLLSDPFSEHRRKFLQVMFVIWAHGVTGNGLKSNVHKPVITDLWVCGTMYADVLGQGGSRNHEHLSGLMGMELEFSECCEW